MARVTVEDCIVQIPNRFELVLSAAQRARDIASGSALKVERDRDKNPVVALREIAESKLNLQQLNDQLIKGLQKHVDAETVEDDVADLMSSEQQNWIPREGEVQSLDDLPDDGDYDEADGASDALSGDMQIEGGANFEDAEVKD
ncbi:MAG: DNA-directed RNA polymerase subunit omega [Alphaproteobacteria bacterium]|nr:DNA-directed RNA polymerase subunit omega [Alphaproteobacteria bacterium]NDC56702.1 DNA-directed RNA polymerase subunit omega [Alphaproteobacteria bacterium]NDG04255.1 DNA-directed RNA polymerase subunit omega [Alphaproteobacteria bacterium]